MRKLFTLALVLLVTVAGYSQVKSMSKTADMQKVATMQKAPRMDNMNVNANAQSQPNMTRTNGELDYTYYDWQTNAGPITRTIVWPDGKVNFAFTWASDNTYVDRGTAIGTYDSNDDVWIPSESRVENEKTGFGSIARYKNNGIVVAAHTATECGIYIIENKDNITPNSVPCMLRMSAVNDPAWPNVMTSGPNRDIVHVLATGADDNIYYYRTSDCQSWDKEDVVLPYFTEEYGVSGNWGSNVCYWMETTEDNCLAFVINNAWSDGMVCYSYDNGETWERKVFYHHPGINTTFDTWFMFPRWASCVWGVNGELCVAYELNGSTGEPASGSYYPSLAGVAFWSESLPYHGTSAPVWGVDPTNPLPPTPGQPFIMDSAYVHQDIRDTWWAWGDEATHEMWNEFIGYLPALIDGEVEPDPYAVEEFNITDLSLHGAHNCGAVAMPVLCKLPSSDFDMVAVWSAMDEENTDPAGNHYFKLFAAYSGDGGHTWSQQKHITNDFMLSITEHVYTQATVIGQNLIVACQADTQTGSFVMGDDTQGDDNYYQGYTFDLKDLFPEANVGVQEVEHNNHISVYPNPAVDQLSVTLNKNAEVTVYNIMGQAVMTVEGRIGANTIDISSLTSGIYFISAGNDTQKFIVK